MSKLTSNTEASSEPLSWKMLQDFYDKAQSKPSMCRHVVHPKAKGWINCANCFMAVHVDE